MLAKVFYKNKRFAVGDSANRAYSFFMVEKTARFLKRFAVPLTYYSPVFLNRKSRWPLASSAVVLPLENSHLKVAGVKNQNNLNKQFTIDSVFLEPYEKSKVGVSSLYHDRSIISSLQQQKLESCTNLLAIIKERLFPKVPFWKQKQVQQKQKDKKKKPKFNIGKIVQEPEKKEKKKKKLTFNQYVRKKKKEIKWLKKRLKKIDINGALAEVRNEKRLFKNISLQQSLFFPYFLEQEEKNNAFSDASVFENEIEDTEEEQEKKKPKKDRSKEKKTR